MLDDWAKKKKKNQLNKTLLPKTDKHKGDVVQSRDTFPGVMHVYGLPGEVIPQCQRGYPHPSDGAEL